MTQTSKERVEMGTSRYRPQRKEWRWVHHDTDHEGRCGDGYITIQSTNKSDRPEVTEILDAGSNGYMFESCFSQ